MKRLKNRKGTTLVELLVTFALLAIFLTSAVAAISPCIRIFLQMKYMSYAQNVSTMVMSKVEDEIAMATGKVLVDRTAGGLISFEDSFGTPLYVTKDTDNLLKIHYRGTVNDAGNLENAVDWKYDAKAYQGFIITELVFAESSAGKGVEITLKLENAARDISYSTAKVIECYNLQEDDLVTTGGVITDDKTYHETDA